MDSQSTSLDPADWPSFRQVMHDLADACVDHLETIRQHPWIPMDTASRESLALGDAHQGVGLQAMAAEMTDRILPFGAGNTHPRFFGWVQGTGTAAGLLAEMLAATMNSNCGGRDHGAVYIERDVIDWCSKCFGFPAHSSGVLVSGTSQATVIALAIARLQALGPDSRTQGISGRRRLTFYAVDGVHSAITKAAELTGLGSDSLRSIPINLKTGGMDMDLLAQAVQQDRRSGALPFCVVGTAGSVERGTFDPLDEIADFCAAENLWFHVDGAFGAWTRIADHPWQGLVHGIDRADSLALDFHKWMFVQYDCGLILVRDEAKHRAAFASRPSYLKPQNAGLGGGDPWYCDYGTDLSRSFRALKVWATLRAYGKDTLSSIITGNCQLAAEMGRQVNAQDRLRLSFPVCSNVCCFSVHDDSLTSDQLGQLNTSIVHHLQMTGTVVFSTTKIDGRSVIRAAITNHRTQPQDISASVAAVLHAFHEMNPIQPS